MTHRTTFALDEGTTRSIKALAKLWKVSQAEVVRRAVSLAEKPVSKADPVVLLQQLHHSGEGLPAKVAKAYLAEVREDRKKWRGS
ncbi:MAG: hypothetical protein R3F13_05270 [Prosthecobacter sp.]